jgi:hypothetical protein
MQFCKRIGPLILLTQSLMLCSGCLLADDNTIAYVVAAVSFVLACLLEFFSFRQRRHSAQNTGRFGKHESSSDVPLQAPISSQNHHDHTAYAGRA